MTGVLVIGTRGKSTLARLLHAAFLACGIRCHARITGVVPRQLGPDGTMTPILRTYGGHVAEMRWWLRSLPDKAEAVVLENSAVAPELQPLAGRWLRPEVVVLTNVLADHFEAWGPSQRQAAEVLLKGVPEGCTVIAPAEVLAREDVNAALGGANCRAVASRPETGEAFPDAASQNLSLALTVCDHLGLCRERVLPALRGLPPDLADFRVLRVEGAQLAFAFSANDPESSLSLFRSLGWAAKRTDLLYNHRTDRPARLKEFARRVFLALNWRQLLIVGDKPWPLPKGMVYLNPSGPAKLRGLLASRRRVFGCGNVKGLPLGLLTEGQPVP